MIALSEKKQKAAALKEERTANKMSRELVALICNVSDRTVATWEQGINTIPPGSYKLFKLYLTLKELEERYGKSPRHTSDVLSIIHTLQGFLKRQF